VQYQLTSDQIQELQDLLNAGNRAGFYLQFYNDTVEAGAPSGLEESDALASCATIQGPLASDFQR
jgi:hypothetical protein